MQDDANAGFEHLIPAAPDALDGGTSPYVRHDADSLRLPLIRIKDADAADAACHTAGKNNARVVTVGTGRGASDDGGRGRRAKSHRRVFGQTLRGFIDQQYDFPPK